MDDAEKARIVRDHLAEVVELAGPELLRWGDGYGGQLMAWLRAEIDRAGFAHPKPEQPRKRKISGGLRTRVFERDRYRCVECGSHLDLTADHIHPESAGGPATLDNLQTLCRPCNSRKGVTRV